MSKGGWWGVRSSAVTIAHPPAGFSVGNDHQSTIISNSRFLEMRLCLPSGCRKVTHSSFLNKDDAHKELAMLFLVTG